MAAREHDGTIAFTFCINHSDHHPASVAAFRNKLDLFVQAPPKEFIRLSWKNIPTNTSPTAYYMFSYEVDMDVLTGQEFIRSAITKIYDDMNWQPGLSIKAARSD